MNCTLDKGIAVISGMIHLVIRLFCLKKLSFLRFSIKFMSNACTTNRAHGVLCPKFEHIIQINEIFRKSKMNTTFSPRVVGTKRADFTDVESFLKFKEFNGKKDEEFILAIYDYLTSKIDGTYHWWDKIGRAHV